MELNIYTICSGLLGAGLILALLRLARGPSLPDRVIALELTSVLIVGIILIQVVGGASSLFLDVAIVLALVGFLGTVTFAYFIEREAANE